jgi:hypothetical protein
MAITFPPITIPPRPPDLPMVAPPKSNKDPHLTNDGHLSKWIEDFERVVKDAWTALSTLVAELDKRITILETRISDTYTWGQKGTLTIEEAEPGEEAPVTLLALPLRIVRDEEVVECTAAAEVPGLGGVLLVQHQASGPTGTPPTRADEVEWIDVATLTFEAEMRFVAVTLPTPFKMKKDDTLRVVIAEVGGAPRVVGEEPEELADVVVQARCR